MKALARSYGAIVVGAGPAGLALAARLGLIMDVALVERRAPGWEKPCAGLLCDAAYEELSLLGQPEACLGEPPELALSVILEGRVAPPRRFRSLSRGALGAALRKELPPSVDVFEGFRAELRREGGRFAARLERRGSTDDRGAPTDDRDARTTDRGAVVEIAAPRLVAADGVGSSTRAFLGLPSVSRIGLVQMLWRDAAPGERSPGDQGERSPGDQGEAWMILDPGLCADYYCWIAPRSGRTLVGMKNDELVIERTLAELRKRFPGRFEGEPESVERYAVSKPLDASEVAVTGGGAFLVGEAAGLVTPSSGEGLSRAFSSARLLAEAIEAAGGSGEADGRAPSSEALGAELRAYREAMRESVGEIDLDIARGMPRSPRLDSGPPPGQLARANWTRSSQS